MSTVSWSVAHTKGVLTLQFGVHLTPAPPPSFSQTTSFCETELVPDLLSVDTSGLPDTGILVFTQLCLKH